MTTKSIKQLKEAKLRSRSLCLEARQFFLTLSQTELTVDTAYELIVKHEGVHLEHLAVVLETHTKDLSKGVHLHVYLSYVKCREMSLRHWDYLQRGVHVERVKNRECLLAYLNKENRCRANFDYWLPLLSNRATFSRTLTTMVCDCKFSLADIQHRYRNALSDKPWSSVSKFVNEVNHYQPHTLAQQLRYIDTALIEARLSPSELSVYYADPQFAVLVQAVNDLKRYGANHPHKRCTLSIVAAASTGKTSFFMKLGKYYNHYAVPNDAWHMNLYPNGIFNFWIWNEWGFHMEDINDVLTLFEGLPTDLRIKNSKTRKLDRPMLFLLSNSSWRDLYAQRYACLHTRHPKIFSDKLAALDTRIKELNFGTTNLFFLQKLLVGVLEDIG